MLTEYEEMMRHVKHFNHFVDGEGSEGVFLWDEDCKSIIACYVDDYYWTPTSIYTQTQYYLQESILPFEIYEGYYSEVRESVDNLALVWKRPSKTIKQKQLEALEHEAKKLQQQIEKLKKEIG